MGFFGRIRILLGLEFGLLERWYGIYIVMCGGIVSVWKVRRLGMKIGGLKKGDVEM